jgi:hypothetical protein
MDEDDGITVATEAANARFDALREHTPEKEFTLAVAADNILTALTLLGYDSEDEDERTFASESCQALAFIMAHLDADQAVIRQTVGRLMKIRRDVEAALNDPPDVKALLASVQ